MRNNHDNCDSGIIAALHTCSNNSMDNRWKLAKNDDCAFSAQCNIYRFIKILIMLIMLYNVIKYYTSMSILD